ncbi:MAG TPA: hypothetical protein VE078_17490 [Thermoanaerobaculia bacterium]|nr:hypothetical protein [Thermoanaerobaculia bacterium]
MNGTRGSPLAHGTRRPSTERLRELIAAKLKEAGKSHRWAERRLKLGHGTVTNILAGRTAFRFEHLDLFAELFETTPAGLLAEAEGESTPLAQIKLRLVLQHLTAAIQAAEETTASRARMVS